MADVSVSLAYGETWQVEGGVKRGETWDFSLRWQAGVDVGTGVVSYVDLSAYTIRLSVRRKDEPEESAPLFTLSSVGPAGISLTEGNLRADFRATPNQTNTLIAGKKYKADVRVAAVASPTTYVKFPIRQIEFLAKESQTDA